MMLSPVKTPLLLPTLLVGAFAAFFTWYPISDGDIFWHLAAGREIASTHVIPFIDPFAFTSRNFLWTDLHWLFQLFVYGLESVLGMKGILLANSFVVGSAAALLFAATGSRKTGWFSAILWIVALFEVRYLAPHRPIMLSLFFLSLFLCCLYRYSRGGKLRWLAYLAPVQVLWVNSQPLFILGPAIVTAWVAGEMVTRQFASGGERERARQRIVPLMCALAAAVVVSLVNPWGAGAYKLAFMLFGRTDPSQTNLFASAIAENRPLLSMLGTPDSHYTWATLAMALFALALIVAAPRAVRLPLLFTACAMLFLAFRAQRNIIIFFFAVLPNINTQLGAAYESLTARFPSFARLTAILGGTVLLLFAGFSASSHAALLKSIRGAGTVAPFSFPDGSVEWLAANPVKGNSFNGDRYGGYLLWNWYPREKVFIDTRYAIRPDAFFAEYCAILDNPELFEGVCRQFNITKAVLPTALVSRYLKLAKFLLDSPGWKLAYSDGTEALFIRRGEAGAGDGLDLDRETTVDSLARAIADHWKSSPALRLEGLTRFAEFLFVMGKRESANRVRVLIGRYNLSGS